MNAVKIRNQELEKEYNEINNKYLSIYEENDKLQEQVQTLQYKMSSGGTGAKVSNLNFLAAFNNFLERMAWMKKIQA